MCRKPPTAFEWAHFFVTFLLRNKKVNKRSFKETCFFAYAFTKRRMFETRNEQKSFNIKTDRNKSFGL